MALLCGASDLTAQRSLLNVSYDPTRELYRDVNAAFAQQWKNEHGEALTINTSTAVQESRRVRCSTGWKPTW